MARYANTGEFNVLYPTRRRMATILKRIVRNDVVDGQGTQPKDDLVYNKNRNSIDIILH